MSVIELNDVSVTFHEGGRTVEAVKHVNISVEKGEIFGIVGFSGAGKSTLVRTINLLERPTGGHVIIDGNDITALKGGQLSDLRKNIGFIFQGFNLITNVTVGKNIEFALKAGGYPKAQWPERVRELLALVGLETRSTATHQACQADRSSACPLRVRSPTSRRFSCVTRRQRSGPRNHGRHSGALAAHQPRTGHYHRVHHASA